MGRFSGMEISSSQGWKNPHKLAQGLIFEDFSTCGILYFLIHKNQPSFEWPTNQKAEFLNLE